MKTYSRIARPAGAIAIGLLITVIVAASVGAESEAESLHDSEYAGLRARAEDAMRKLRLSDAATLYRKLTKLTPHDGDAWFGLGAAYELTRRRAKAIEAYTGALEKNPGHYRAMENLARMFETRAEDVEKALDLYRQALALDPRPVWKENLRVWIKMLESRATMTESSAITSLRRGHRHARESDHEQALTAYTEALNRNSQLYQAHFGRGLCFARAGRHGEALNEYTKGLSICPTYPGGLVLRGKAWERIGRIQQAHADYKAAIRVDPGDPEAAFYYARAMEREGKKRIALQWYRRALSSRPPPRLRPKIGKAAAQVRPAATAQERRTARVFDTWGGLW